MGRVAPTRRGWGRPRVGPAPRRLQDGRPTWSYWRAFGGYTRRHVFGSDFPRREQQGAAVDVGLLLDVEIAEAEAFERGEDFGLFHPVAVEFAATAEAFPVERGAVVEAVDAVLEAGVLH